MRLYRIVLVILLLGMSLCGGSLGQAQPTSQAKLVLFTSHEAEQLRMSEDEWQRNSQRRALSVGPRIMIQRPEVKNTEAGPMILTTSPTNLSVLFEENRAPVDMASLQVRARKGIFTKSLTALLQPHVSGSCLDVEGVEIPEGRFHVEIEIADVDGMKTIETYGLEVRKQ